MNRFLALQLDHDSILDNEICSETAFKLYAIVDDWSRFLPLYF